MNTTAPTSVAPQSTDSVHRLAQLCPTNGRTDALTNAVVDERVNPSSRYAREKSNLIEIQQIEANKEKP